MTQLSLVSFCTISAAIAMVSLSELHEDCEPSSMASLAEYLLYFQSHLLLATGMATPTFLFDGVSVVFICHVLNLSIHELVCIRVLVTYLFLSMSFFMEFALSNVTIHTTPF